MRARLLARIAQVPGAVVAVSFRDLGSGHSLDLNAGLSFHAASTMKVPVMIELFRQVERGWLSLDQPLLLVNQFGSIVDGSPFSVDAGDDSDSLMYRSVGERVPVRELLERMIVRSSNLATNALIAVVDARRANATAHELGARDIRVLRGVEDQKAYDAGMNNTTTARDLAVLLADFLDQRPRARELFVRFLDVAPAGSESILPAMRLISCCVIAFTRSCAVAALSPSVSNFFMTSPRLRKSFTLSRFARS